MTANDLLTVITQVFFIVLGLLAAIEYIHYRDSTRRDIALMFGTFAILFGGQLFQRIAGVQIWWLTELSTAALLAQPYLLLRLARYYRSIPTRLMQGALAGMLISWALILIQPSLPQDASIITALVMIIYLVVIDGYAMISFVPWRDDDHRRRAAAPAVRGGWFRTFRAGIFDAACGGSHTGAAGRWRANCPEHCDCLRHMLLYRLRCPTHAATHVAT